MTDFRSDQLQVCAFLVASGATLKSCEQNGRNHCEFLFHDPDGEIEQLASRYYKGETCQAIRFYRALLELKSTINRTLYGGGR